MRENGMNTTHTVRKVNYPENDNSAKDVSILWYTAWRTCLINSPRHRWFLAHQSTLENLVYFNFQGIMTTTESNKSTIIGIIFYFIAKNRSELINALLIKYSILISHTKS